MNWRNSILLIALVLMTCQLWAQNGPVRDRVKTLKVAFITERLSLTSKEAQLFWPVYNEHEEKLEAIRRKERMELRGRASMVQELSDGEASKLLSQYLSLQQEKQQVEREMVTNLQEVISAKKIIMLFKAEEDFKKRLLQQYRKRRAGGGG